MLLDKLRKTKKSDVQKTESPAKNVQEVTISIIEHAYDAGEYVDAAIMLRELLEYYGERKKKNHRNKGREFIYFILSSKHKDLKNVGHTHWVNINKIIKSRNKVVYPYHKQNLQKAIDFFKKEIKSLNSLRTIIVH